MSAKSALRLVFIAFFVSVVASPGCVVSTQSDEQHLESLVQECDAKTILRRDQGSFGEVMRDARAIRDLGIDRKDRAIQARGLARMAFAEVIFSHWEPEWEDWMLKAFELTEDESTPSLARAEVLMFDGYLKAMYLDKAERGLAQLHEAVAIGISLDNDRLLGQAFRYVAGIVNLAGQPSMKRQMWCRSILFAERAEDETIEYVSRQYLLMGQRRDNVDVDQENRKRVLALGKKLGVEGFEVAYEAEEMLRRQRKYLDTHAHVLQEEEPNPHVLLRLLNASVFLCKHKFKEHEWEQAKKDLEVAQASADKLRDKTTARLLTLYDALLAAKGGDGTRALEIMSSLDEIYEKKNATAVLVPVYSELGVLFNEAGDSVTASECWRRATIANSNQLQEAWSQAGEGAKNYLNEYLQTGNLRSVVRAKENALDRTLIYHRILLFALPLLGACLYFWQRSRHHWRAQNELQHQVALQTDSLRLAKEEAESASRAKTHFVTRINHELRNPLASIIGSIELLDDARNEELPELKKTIRACSENLLSTIDEVLDFSNIEAGRLELYEQAFRPSELLKDVGKIASPRVLQGVELRLHVADDTPEWLHGDVGKLRQILVNLTQNAARHTTEGTIEVRCRVDDSDLGRDDSDGENVRLRFEVEDTGEGIPESRQATIFAEFEGSQLGTGSGLGLYISSAFADRMRGDLSCPQPRRGGFLFYIVRSRHDLPPSGAERKLSQNNRRRVAHNPGRR